MYHFFPTSIQTYYIRRKNRIVFKNGMTLNQLALAMWEKLGFEEIDPSVVSRVINGKRLFTFKQLKNFCDLMGVSQKERNILFESLTKDLLSRSPTHDQNSVSPVNYGLVTFQEIDDIDVIAQKLSRQSSSLFKNLKMKLIPAKGHQSLIGLPFTAHSYYHLVDNGIQEGKWSFDKKFAGFDVSIPGCEFSKTVLRLKNNCRCGYHLSLYGVIKKAIHIHSLLRKDIQNEINHWVSFFFPKETILCYLRNHQKNKHYRPLFSELKTLVS